VAAEVETVHDPALKYGLEFGVAFLHDIMRPGDRAVAERLFASGAVQVQLLPASGGPLLLEPGLSISVAQEEIGAFLLIPI
jgi:hypothetical protein